MPVPSHLHAVIEDASVLSSADGALDRLVRGHLEHRQAWYGEVVGPLVVPDSLLPRLLRLPEVVPTDPLDVVVAVSGGAGALEPAVLWATRGTVLRLRGLQVTMRESDAGDLAPNARRIVAAVDALVAAGALDEDVPVYVEPPPLPGPEPTPSWLSALDELAAVDHRLTLRAHGTGGPSSGQLAACIDAALDRELTFRCTGPRGVQQPGAAWPGFLDVLMATRAGLDGASPTEMSAVLESTDVPTLTGAALTSTRRWCTSFDTDSVADPVHDLVELGWLSEG